MLINYQYARRQNFCCMQSRAAQRRWGWPGAVRNWQTAQTHTNARTRTHLLFFDIFCEKRKLRKSNYEKSHRHDTQPVATNATTTTERQQKLQKQQPQLRGNQLAAYVCICKFQCVCVWLCIGWRQRNLASVLCASSSYKKGKLCGVDGGWRGAGGVGAAWQTKIRKK